MLKVLPEMQNLMGDLLKLTETILLIEYRTEDIREYPTRCNLVDFRRPGHNCEFLNCS